jgi:hypothetical protein
MNYSHLEKLVISENYLIRGFLNCDLSNDLRNNNGVADNNIADNSIIDNINRYLKLHNSTPKENKNNLVLMNAKIFDHQFKTLEIFQLVADYYVSLTKGDGTINFDEVFWVGATKNQKESSTDIVKWLIDSGRLSIETFLKSRRRKVRESGGPRLVRRFVKNYQYEQNCLMNDENFDILLFSINTVKKRYNENVQSDRVQLLLRDLFIHTSISHTNFKNQLFRLLFRKLGKFIKIFLSSRGQLDDEKIIEHVNVRNDISRKYIGISANIGEKLSYEKIIAQILKMIEFNENEIKKISDLLVAHIPCSPLVDIILSAF